MPEQSYQHGVYCVLDDVPYASSVRRFIETQEFREVCRGEPFATSNRRNKLYAFDFEPAGRRMVVKVSAVDPELAWRRRASLFVTSLAKNYPRAAFAGARILAKADIPGASAVAYWTYRPNFRRLEGYYLYEEIPARTSVHRFRADIGAEPSALERRAFERIVEDIAGIVRALHANGIRHGALELGNFLVDFGNGLMRPTTEAEAENPRLYLIDTDRVSKARIRQPFLKRILDLNCLRRLDFDREGRHVFLRHYLGADHAPAWGWVLELWRIRRFRLRRWLRGESRGLDSPLQPR